MTAETQRKRRGHDFYPPAESMATIPPLYGNESVALADQVIRLHYFGGACDWWLTEYDQLDQLAFGYACLGDLDLAEWGYVSLVELEALTLPRQPLFIVERDLYWQPQTVAEAHLPGSPM